MRQDGHGFLCIETECSGGRQQAHYVGPQHVGGNVWEVRTQAIMAQTCTTNSQIIAIAWLQRTIMI